MTLRSATLALAAMSLAGAAAAADVVRLGTEGAYPPYNFLNDAGEVAGFEREVGDELCKRAQLECEWVTNDWDSIIPNLLSGNYDVIIAGMSITAERREVINFSENYFQPASSAFAAASEDADLSGVVSAQASTIQAAYVAESGATVLEFATPDETVAAVKSGEADAVFADKDFLLPIVEADSELVMLPEEVLLGEGMGLGIRKSDTELKAKFDAAIQSMKADGTLNKMIEKWVPDAPLFD